MAAQSKRAKEMALPAVRAKVKEYYYQYRFLREIIDQTGLNGQSKILDIGCGIKTVLHFLPGALKVGLDTLADDYRKIYNYPQDLTIQKSPGEKIVYPTDFFDVVFITNALDHTKNPRQVVTEAGRVLKKFGYLAIVNELVPEAGQRDRAHPHNLDKDGILSLLENKFRIIFIKYSPWLGIRQYYLGATEPAGIKDKQITILAQKL
ncbi:MAG: methyltransferase domain-containing protein [bacterium]